MTKQELERRKLELLYSKCPRCGNKLFLEADSVGYFQNCVCCGYQCDLEKPTTKEREDWGMKE
jgi:transcription elongation factor Elf1